MDELEKRFPRSISIMRELATAPAFVNGLWQALDYAIADKAVAEASRIVGGQFSSNVRLKIRPAPSKDNPEKQAAHRAVQVAVDRGLLKKPENCEKCRHFMRPQFLHGHHEDYTKPLKVIWLCPSCHAKEHTGLEQVSVHRVRSREPFHGRQKQSAPRDYRT